MFILMYVLSYVGGANLLRHAEGATWLAVVTVRLVAKITRPVWPSVVWYTSQEQISSWVVKILQSSLARISRVSRLGHLII